MILTNLCNLHKLIIHKFELNSIQKDQLII